MPVSLGVSLGVSLWKDEGEGQGQGRRVVAGSRKGRDGTVSKGKELHVRGHGGAKRELRGEGTAFEGGRDRETRHEARKWRGNGPGR